MQPNTLSPITFMGRTFYRNSTVHLPRPSTEFICKEGYIPYLQQVGPTGVVAADIGAGSGVITLSSALECTNIDRVYGIDLFAEAITIAKKNARRLGADKKVTLLQGDTFTPLLHTPVDVIIANLPCASDDQIEYITTHSKMKDEPLATIYGGPTGFELYEQLFSQLKDYEYMDRVVGIWLFGCDTHAPILKRYHAAQFPEFTLMTFADKYKPYFTHGLLTKTAFRPGPVLQPIAHR